jgi:pyruvate dehydrogenase E1 component alpha subunit
MAATESADDAVRVLDDDGTVLDEGVVESIPEDVLVDVYRDMKFARRFDRRAVSLQRQGRMGTYPPLYGHEGAQVGSAHALDDGDWLFPSYRDNAAGMVRGVEPWRNLANWMGHPVGNSPPEDANVFTMAHPIATHLPHATGAAWAARLRGDDTAALALFGDGATSEGDFHEALNFAGVFDVPAVFLCNNNQWAISVPIERQTASATIAQKAVAYGIEGVRVDGMDPLAVYAVTREAVERAKAPDGDGPCPTLIEAELYRLGAHSTSDDPEVYRDESVTEEWERRDPLRRTEAFLLDTGRIDEEGVDAVEDAVEEELSAAIDRAEAYESDADEVFSGAYAEETPRLRRQHRWLDDHRGRIEAANEEL